MSPAFAQGARQELASDWLEELCELPWPGEPLLLACATKPVNELNAR